jgi:hypothetical protein
VIDVVQVDAGFAQAVVNGMKRQFISRERNGTFAVLDAGEALLFGGRERHAIANDACGRVVKDRVDA